MASVEIERASTRPEGRDAIEQIAAFTRKHTA
jgi:hypothetical protein